jgi:hypothetical protein
MSMIEGEYYSIQVDGKEMLKVSSTSKAMDAFNAWSKTKKGCVRVLHISVLDLTYAFKD